MVKFAINGFGRIGRLAFRAALNNPNGGRVVRVNNPGLDIDYALYMLKHDSAHGLLKNKIEKTPTGLLVDGQKVDFTFTTDPKEANWGASDIDVVLDCTGVYLEGPKAQQHIDAGAKKVLLSAPPKDDTPLFVMGVNHEEYKGQKILSNASCTTNCLAPVASVIDNLFGLDEGLMTTIHAVTINQPTVDGPSKKDWRAGRAAGVNIIPASTGAAKAVGKVIPNLNGRLTGMAFRVPTVNVSAVDLTFRTAKKTSYKEICEAMKEASEGKMKGFLGYTEDMVVSTDFMSDPRSSVFDAKAGMQLNDQFFKVVSWYDNEWGYSNRMIDMANYIAKR